MKKAVASTAFFYLKPVTLNPPIELRRLLQAAEKEFRKAGVPSPERDAELLLAHRLGLKRHELYLDGEETPTEEALRRFRDDVERRAHREPLQFILGETWFYGLRFRVRPGAFVPRPETEVLVERAIELAPKEGGLAYDLCCGIGNIACALAVNREKLRVTATDLSVEAVALTRENAALCGVGERVAVFQTDLDAGLTERADLLCCNPPYVPTGEIAGLEPEVRDHDPRAALDGGTDGLDFIRRLAGALKNLTKPGGRALVEIGDGQGEAVRRIFEVLAEVERVEIRKDLAGRERVATIQLAQP